jgi:hypothetical protein
MRPRSSATIMSNSSRDLQQKMARIQFRGLAQVADLEQADQGAAMAKRFTNDTNVQLLLGCEDSALNIWEGTAR